MYTYVGLSYELVLLCLTACLCDFVIDHYLFQQVNKPTRIHGNILDLVITSNAEPIADLVAHPHTTYPLQSDHSIVILSICTTAVLFTIINTGKYIRITGSL